MRMLAYMLDDCVEEEINTSLSYEEARKINDMLHTCGVFNETQSLCVLEYLDPGIGDSD